MPRRQAARLPPTTDDTEETITPIDEVRQQIVSIEEVVHRRYEEINDELNSLKTNSEKTRQNECHHEENFLKLCHAVDFLLEHMDHDYDTIACREMVSSLLGQRSARPFSGRTIRNRVLCKRIKRWCLFITFVLFIVACMTIYGLHRDWCYLLVIVCLSGSIISSIGVRRIYKIIEAVW
ncbi:unnamed protein product [Rotaria socialis]|uniref:Transmembrane protein n=1 Tax=Rotaria socialis TaxID=392032 RepID=A0A818KY83_9BILA|nr:unnamed protein product [Rotaria socialis]CAF4737401.1 unnamed protein product [Rotaria socialis]